MKTIGIVGSRKRDTEKDYELVRAEFLRWYIEGDRIVSGGCPKGGDAFAVTLACEFEAEIITHEPDKSQLDERLDYRATYAKIAYARNTLIARDADILIACVAPDRTGGTEDTIKKFRRKLGRRASDPPELRIV